MISIPAELRVASEGRRKVFTGDRYGEISLAKRLPLQVAGLRRDQRRAPMWHLCIPSFPIVSIVRSNGATPHKGVTKQNLTVRKRRDPRIRVLFLESEAGA